jgi:hypothetical protein
MLPALIIGVLAATALLVYAMWAMGRHAERSERDPKYLRRFLFRFGTVYAIGSVCVIVQAANGKLPTEALIGLPIPLLFAWFFLRTASRVKTP